jgi:hypothetical protein
MHTKLRAFCRKRNSEDNTTDIQYFHSFLHKPKFPVHICTLHTPHMLKNSLKMLTVLAQYSLLQEQKYVNAEQLIQC